MLVIYPPKKAEKENDKAAEVMARVLNIEEQPSVAKTEKVERAAGVRPSDWQYMEQSGEILKSPPQTWSVYPKTIEGLSAVIDMEYQELKGAEANRPKHDIMRELVHLGTATLALWRLYNAAE